MLSQWNTDRLGLEEDIQPVVIPSWLSNLDPRVLRLSISSLSILTTKAIYIHGYHHPLRLSLLHLLATSLWEIFLWLSSNKIERAFDAKDYTLYNLTRRGNPWSRTGLKLCLRLGFGLGALFCEYEAIHRFRSLPALAMLLLPDWSLLVRLIRNTDVPTPRKIVVCFGCLGGVAMVLVFEHQLSEVGLKLSMITGFLAVASQMLRQESDALDDNQLISSSLPIAPVRDKALLLPLAVLAAIVAIYMREYLIYTPPLSNTLLVTLAINTLAAVVSFQFSGLYFRQTEPLATFNGVKEDHDEDEIDPAFETISLQCVISLGSVLVDLTIGSSSSGSIRQYIGFWISLGTLLWASRQLGPCAEGDGYHTPTNALQDCRLSGIDTFGSLERQRGIKWSNLFQAIFAGLCMLLSISPLLFTHTSPDPSRHWLPRTDHSASNTTQTLDFVVSRYNEPAAQLANQINTLHSLPNMNSLSTRLIVYNTGPDNTSTYKHQLLQHLHPSINTTILQRPNTGREAATYLTHLLSPPFSFASHTFFLQAEMHSPSLILPRITNYFTPSTGFLSLSSTHQTSNTCALQPWDHSTWSEHPSILSAIYTHLNISNCVDYTFTYRGQFIVSAARMLATPASLYHLLLQNLIDQNANTHTDRYKQQAWLPGKQDSLNAPLFGYTMERIWGLVFGCQGKMEGCPSLLAGAVGDVMGGGRGRKGGAGDCQCLDTM